MSTNTNNQNISPDEQIVCNLLAQRSRFFSLLTPPPRYTPISPYPKNTRFQLDMRRKAEILQYKKNTTQANQFTKSQKWSWLNTATNTQSAICAKNILVPTPSSACGVPGPPTVLYYDPTVPLYNYVKNENAYANFTENVTILWSPQISSGSMFADNGIETTLFSLAIRDVENPQYTFSFDVPVGLYVSGRSVVPSSTFTENLKINTATLNVYYYTTLTGNTPVYSATQNIVTNSSSVYDASMSLITNLSALPFTGNQYLGTLSFTNIKLKTTYGYVYDFKLIFNVNVDPPVNTSNEITDFNYGVYMNFPVYDTSANNCTIVPQNPPIFNPNTYRPFTFSGI